MGERQTEVQGFGTRTAQYSKATVSGTGYVVVMSFLEFIILAL